MTSSSPPSEKSAYHRALTRLARRETTRQDLTHFLVRAGYEESEVVSALDRLEKERFLDDQRFARAWIRHSKARGKGPRWIEAGLRKKGIKISDAKLKEWMAPDADSPIPYDELEHALRILKARYGEVGSDRAKTQRAYQGLIRRGFSFYVARQAIQTSTQAPADSELTDEDPSLD